MNLLETPSPAISTNADLIGHPDSRLQLDTPCLLIDKPVLEANIKRASEMVAAAGKDFSPHLKAHKTPQIAALQRTAGVSGFCVASIGEAEVFAGMGDTPITITSSLITERQIIRVAQLARRLRSLTVVVDNPVILQKLSTLDVALSVLIDIDMGRGRSACREEVEAVHLARKIEAAANLKLAGLQCYAGQLSHMIDFEERQTKAVEADKRAKSFMSAVQSVAQRPLRCSGGSTGASRFDLVSSALTDLQWGSYALMDVEYVVLQNSCSGDPLPFQPALRVATRVISNGQASHVVMDAGDKRFASKYGALPRVVAPERFRDATFKPVSDEHGELRASKLPSLGQMIELLPPHCDPTVNLFDALHVVDGDRLVDIWQVSARGVY